MSKGGGGCSSKGGGGKNAMGGGSVKISKSRKLKASADKLVRLRQAIFDEAGKDKDVTAGLAPALMAFDRNGVDAKIAFSTRLSKADRAWAVELSSAVSEAEDDAGREWNEEDKDEQLSEEGTRFLVARDTATQAPLAFVHFRFSLPGELADLMVGEPSVVVFDVHVAAESQRKGLGKHLVTLCELIARREAMEAMLVSMANSELSEDGKCFFLNGLKGWKEDSLYGVDMELGQAIEQDGSLLCLTKALPLSAAAVKAAHDADQARYKPAKVADKKKYAAAAPAPEDAAVLSPTSVTDATVETGPKLTKAQKKRQKQKARKAAADIVCAVAAEADDAGSVASADSWVVVDEPPLPVPEAPTVVPEPAAAVLAPPLMI